MKPKYNILFLSGWYPSKVSPTNGDFVQRHAEAMAKTHNVTVLHCISDKTITKLSQKSQQINNVNTLIYYIPFTKNPIIKFYRFIKTYINSYTSLNTIDIVHLNIIYPKGIIALYLKYRYRIPYIITEHWTGYHYPNSKRISKFQLQISKWICTNAAKICPVSNDLANSMRKLQLKGNYKSIPNVVDTSLFTPELKPPKKFTIVHLSNMLNEHKNVKGILRVLLKLQKNNYSFCFHCIGGNTEQVEKYADEIGLSKKEMIFKNHIPQELMVDYLKKASVFVLFSNYENLPCVILESFSVGVPVISTDVGGINEYFPETFGDLIPPKDEIALFNALVKHYKGVPVNKLKMHQYAAENFSADSINDEFTKIYYNTINNV